MYGIHCLVLNRFSPSLQGQNKSDDGSHGGGEVAKKGNDQTGGASQGTASNNDQVVSTQSHRIREDMKTPAEAIKVLTADVQALKRKRSRETYNHNNDTAESGSEDEHPPEPKQSRQAGVEEDTSDSRQDSDCELDSFLERG